MSSKRRSATCTSRDRGEVSREKLVRAGVKIYSEVGFQSASTRRLAAEAGVNIAAIPYYFGSKEGLYHAVLDYVVEFYRGQLGDALARIQQAMEDPETTGDGYMELLDEFMRLVVHFILKESPERARISRIYIREQLDPTSGFTRLYEGFIREMRETHEGLVAAIMGCDVHSLEVKLLSQSMIGQVMIFKSSRGTVLKHLGWTRYGEERIEAIEEIVSRNVRALMQAYCRKEGEL